MPLLAQLAHRTFYTQYSKVCGRVIGIQVASPDAFFHGMGSGINENYMDGVSITRGSPRHHIWSYIGSLSEIRRDNNVYPCTYSSTTQPPSFVGSNYYSTANQAIQPKIGKVKYFQMTSCGMESSVVMKVHAALVPTLHHGSV